MARALTCVLLALVAACALALPDYPMHFHSPAEDSIDGHTVTPDMVTPVDVSVAPVDAALWDVTWSICSDRPFNLERFAKITMLLQVQDPAEARPPPVSVPLCYTKDVPDCTAQKAATPACLKGSRRMGWPGARQLIESGKAQLAVVLQDSRSRNAYTEPLVPTL